MLLTLITMPYNRSRRTRRNTYRRRRRNVSWYNKKYSVGDIAYKGYKLATKLAKWVNVEFKTHNIQTTSTVDYNGYVLALTAIPQGDTDITRDGDSLKVQHLKSKVLLTGDATNNTRVRCVIMEVKQGASLSASNYFSTIGSSYAPLASKLWDTRFQTRTLYDSGVVSLSPATNNQKVLDINLPIGRHVQYSAGSTTVISGALQMIIVSDQSVNLPSFRLNTDVIFTDN